ncbi:MAG: hypothetical protein WBG92_22195 [Thiohalocapsa sp.]
MTPRGPRPLEGPDDARSDGLRRGVPQIEVVTRSEQVRSPRSPGRDARPLLFWFLAVFALVLVPASIWNFARPPVYRAAAAVLTIVPESRSGFGGNNPDVQHVAIQRQLLLGRQLLAETLERVHETPLDSVLVEPQLLTPDDLRPLLSVDSIPSTNLVEMSAIGANPDLLAAIVNHWLNAYEALRQKEISDQVGGRLQQLDEQASGLEDKIQQKRFALDAFRETHDIVTLERDGNQALSRLQALQTSLAEAEKEAIQARAQLRALEAALANGEIVMPEGQAAALRALQEKAAELRVQVAQQKKRYTDMFIQNDPSKRALPERLARIEARIDEMARQGRRDVINEARQLVESTTARVLTLQRELGGQKLTASRFSTSFTEYEDLKSDLTELETMQRDTEVERTALETEAVDEYPQIEVIEPAYAPRDPVHPHYLRDLSFSALAAAAAGLATVLTLLFLDARANARPAPMPVTGVRIWGKDPEPGANQDGQLQPHFTRRESNQGLGAPPTGALPDIPLRQLMGGEVEALWDLASDDERQLIGLLLSGLRLDELNELSEDDFDPSDCRLRVNGGGARAIILAPSLCRLLGIANPLPAWRDDPVHALEELYHRIPLLAMDAGLAHAHEVIPEVLRHTYIIYLVRQGARLTELHRVAGPMGAAEVQRYARYSPPGASRPLEQLQLVYPALA